MLLVNSWVVWCDMQAKSICICTNDGIKVGLLYVKSIESDSHSASYTSFMLDTINAMIFKLILPNG